MPMPAMRAENDVTLAQMRAHTDSDGLFANVRVASAVDETALVRPGKLLFALADELHVVKQIEERLLADAGGKDGGHIESIFF